MTVVTKRILSIDMGHCDFDSACNRAYEQAISTFGIDEYGHSETSDFDRTNDKVVVEFKGYIHSGSMLEQNRVYLFEARIER